MKAGHWLLSAICCAAAFAAPPPAAALAGQSEPGETGEVEPSPAAASSVAGPSAAATPNDEFIEFLGTVDVEDTAWWEFLKKSTQLKARTPPPPQDPKQ